MLLTKVALLFDETPVADAIDPANFAINVELIAVAARAATIKGSTIERSSTGATIANGDTLLYGYALTGTSKQDVADDVFILGNLSHNSPFIKLPKRPDAKPAGMHGAIKSITVKNRTLRLRENHHIAIIEHRRTRDNSKSYQKS